MDNATKRKLKQNDQFVALTQSGASWASSNRSTAIGAAVIAVVVILIGVLGYTFFQHRTDEARAAFGQAMATYQTPVASPTQEVPPGVKTFGSVAERAKASNGEFLAVADKYGMTEPGRLARYFAGLTYMEEGNNSQAEDTLKKVSGSWNSGLSALAKMALAGLYQQTGQRDQAVKLYDELAKGHAATVPPGLAKIQLGEMYQAEGRTEDARKEFAEVKDQDKGPKGKLGAAGQLAEEKLNPTPQQPGMPQ